MWQYKSHGTWLVTMIDKEMEFRAARDRERSNLLSHKSGGGW